MNTRSLILCLGMLATAPASARDWVQWRGDNGQGHAPEATGLPTTWSEEKNITWKTKTPGRGWSSPVVLGDEIWITTAIETKLPEEERQRRKEAAKEGQPQVYLDKIVLRAICIDKATGAIRHDVELMVQKDPQSVHTMNSFASPTPVIEPGRLYCHFGTYGTTCLDTKTQRIIWTNREHRIQHENGPGGSPLLWKDLLIFHCDGSDVQYLVALDKKTGREKWRTPRSGEMNENHQLKKSYATPAIGKRGDRLELLSPAADWLYAYDMETGKENWKLKYGSLGFSNVPPPVLGDGFIYLPTCFMRSELLAITYQPDAEPEIAWRYKKNVPTTPAPILIGGELYIVSDQGGMMTCLDAKSGEVHWKERVKAARCNAAPTFADGKIFVHGLEGTTSVLKPGKEFKVLAENNLDGKIYASAAVSGKALFLRTDSALYRIEEKGLASR